MTLQISFHGGPALCVLSDFLFCGNRIAYCGANSITLESPYHFLRSGASKREAPGCWDHHHGTVAGESQIKRRCVPQRNRLEEE